MPGVPWTLTMQWKKGRVQWSKGDMQIKGGRQACAGGGHSY